jgi:hypothetical protein
MRIQTDIPAATISDAIAGGAEFAIYQGKVVGSEQAHMPDWRDNAWALKRSADDMIEQAAAALGQVWFDADPVQIEIMLISAEGQEIQAKGWLDRREISK